MAEEKPKPKAEPKEKEVAQPSATPAPAPAKKSNTVLWVVLGCCGGCLVLSIIIGILMAIIVGVAGSAAKDMAQNVEVKSNARTVQVALEAFYSDNETYPTDLNALIPKYLTEIKYPSTGEKYIYTSDGKTYVLKIKLPKPEADSDSVNGYYEIKYP